MPPNFTINIAMFISVCADASVLCNHHSDVHETRRKKHFTVIHVVFYMQVIFMTWGENINRVTVIWQSSRAIEWQSDSQSDRMTVTEQQSNRMTVWYSDRMTVTERQCDWWNDRQSDRMTNKATEWQQQNDWQSDRMSVTEWLMEWQSKRMTVMGWKWQSNGMTGGHVMEWDRDCCSPGKKCRRLRPVCESQLADVSQFQVDLMSRFTRILSWEVKVKEHWSGIRTKAGLLSAKVPFHYFTLNSMLLTRKL